MDYYEPRDDLDATPFHPPEELSPIQKVYEGACIFITGGTGFMGQVLLEKLLRTCNVGKVYLLVRGKKGVEPRERLKAIFNDRFFEPLKLQKPGEVAKVSLVTGDCTLPDLGLSEIDKVRLANVNFIFHAAATLYMDQHLSVAFRTNILATKSLLEFAKTLPRLKAFMYISTAYTHAYKDLVEEKFYDLVLDDEEIGYLCNQMDDVQIGALTPKLTGRWKNTYALTKACAENLISKYDGILPIGIVRPSIVVSTWAEPLLGWTNNIYGAMGVVMGVALGVLRVWCCDPNIVADLIPVDIAINMTLAATYEVVVKNSHIMIYNCVSSSQNPVTWRASTSANFEQNDSTRLDSSKAIALPSYSCVKSKTLFYLQSIWYHVIPSFFIDMFLKITGQSPRLLKLYSKIYYINTLLMPYCAEKEILFSSDNVNRLWETLDPVDKILFNFDLKMLNWGHFWLQALKGLRVYMANDPMDTLPEGAKRRFKLQIIKYTCDFFVWTGVTSLSYFLSRNLLSKYFMY